MLGGFALFDENGQNILLVLPEAMQQTLAHKNLNRTERRNEKAGTKKRTEPEKQMPIGELSIGGGRTDAGKRQRTSKLDQTELIRLTSAAMWANNGLIILAAPTRSLALTLGSIVARPNQDKIGDGYRERAQIEVEVF